MPPPGSALRFRLRAGSGETGTVWQLFRELGSEQGKYQIRLKHLVATECKDNGHQNDGSILKNTVANLKEQELKHKLAA